MRIEPAASIVLYGINYGIKFQLNFLNQHDETMAENIIARSFSKICRKFITTKRSESIKNSTVQLQSSLNYPVRYDTLPDEYPILTYSQVFIMVVYYFSFSKNLVSKKQPKFFSKTTVVKLFCKPVRIRYSSLRVHANDFRLNNNCFVTTNVINRTCFSHTSVARFRLKSETFLLPNCVWSLFYDVLLISWLQVVTTVFSFGTRIRVSFRIGCFEFSQNGTKIQWIQGIY